MKTKTFYFPLLTSKSTEEVDQEVNAFLKKNRISYKDSDIVYDLGETYLFVVICWGK